MTEPLMKYPTTWPLQCPRCGERIRVELPADVQEGSTGTVTCRRDHPVLFGYDGMTVMPLEFVSAR